MILVILLSRFQQHKQDKSSQYLVKLTYQQKLNDQQSVNFAHGLCCFAGQPDHLCMLYHSFIRHYKYAIHRLRPPEVELPNQPAKRAKLIPRNTKCKSRQSQPQTAGIRSRGVDEHQTYCRAPGRSTPWGGWRALFQVSRGRIDKSPAWGSRQARIRRQLPPPLLRGPAGTAVGRRDAGWVSSDRPASHPSRWSWPPLPELAALEAYEEHALRLAVTS
jgi:hypothetical protein